MRRTLIVRTADDIRPLRSCWEALCRERPATIFQSFAWNWTAARVFSGREEPLVIFSESDSGAALVPAAIPVSRSHLQLMGEALFDYRDVLVAGDAIPLHTAWQEAARTNLPLLAWGMHDFEDTRWSGFHLQPFYGAPRVSPREISPTEFASRHNRLARSLRRLSRFGVSLRQYTGAESALVRSIYEAKAAQRGDNSESSFSDPLRVRFMVEIAALCGSACEIFTLQSAGSLVAALVTFRDAGVRRFYTVYFDAAWAKHSPGIALVYHATCQSLEQGLECDYMTGEHSYKLRLATGVTRLYWTRAEPHLLSNLSQPASQVAA